MIFTVMKSEIFSLENKFTIITVNQVFGALFIDMILYLFPISERFFAIDATLMLNLMIFILSILYNLVTVGALDH